jgi:class 3 adenylate cyclase
MFARRHASEADLPTCGHCGYAVTGLTTFICPECGRDLRVVGIVRAGAKRGALRGPFMTFFRIVGWKLALFAILFSIAAFYGIDHYVDRVRPTTWLDNYIVELRPRADNFKSVTVTLNERFVSRGFSRPPGTPVTDRKARIELFVGPEKYVFVRDVLNGVNTFTDKTGVEQTSKRSLSDELGPWMAARGIDVSTPDARGQIDVISDAVTQSSTHGAFFDILANQSFGYFERKTAYLTGGPDATPFNSYLIGTLAAIVLGVGGLTLIWRHDRERLAQALSGVAPPPRPAPAATIVEEAESPPRTPAVRTLSVMFSDVKDYTARTAKESRLGVLDLVRRHRELVQPIVKRRGGRIVKSLGDGLLVTFESATEALLAGLEIQSAATAVNRNAFSDRDKIELRIAVSTGEVAVDQGDVFGEAVNLASRAQQHAAAGEVLFTELTCATLNRQEVRFADAGTFEFKGIAHPVRLYRALPLDDAPTLPAQPRRE